MVNHQQHLACYTPNGSLPYVCYTCSIDIGLFYWECINARMIFKTNQDEERGRSLSVTGETEQPNDWQMNALRWIIPHQYQFVEYINAFRN